MKSQFKRVVNCEYTTIVDYPSDEALDKYVDSVGQEAILSVKPPLTVRVVNQQALLNDPNAPADITIDAEGKPVVVEAKNPPLSAVPQGPK